MKLAEFARWAIENGCFEGCALDGGDIQEKAEACGLITETVYDPEKHGAGSEAMPGDQWFVFSDGFRAALKQES